MEWQVWVYMRSGVSVFSREFATQNDARWWAIAWLKDGYVPIDQDDPDTEYFLPLGSGGTFVVYITKKGGATPVNTLHLDSISGIDTGP